MKAFIATAIVSLLCLCTFRVPLVAQVARNPNAIDVHLHAMHPENFSVPASANFGAVRKTFGTNERDPEALLRRTIAEMDKNHVSKGIISGDDDVVAKWVERYPNRFLPSYNHSTLTGLWKGCSTRVLRTCFVASDLTSLISPRCSQRGSASLAHRNGAGSFVRCARDRRWGIF
jgi:hypothetical protein